MHTISIVTIHYHCADVLQRLFDSAERLGSLPEAEWIIIDHSPEPPPLSQRLRFPANFGSVRVIEDARNSGFSGGCNLGASNSDGQVLFFLNPDCLFQGGSIRGFADRLMTEERTAALSPLLMAPNGRPEFSFSRFPGLLSEARLRAERILGERYGFVQRAINRRFEKPHWVDWVTGGALFIRREAFFHVGGFDDEFFLYFEDADLCKRVHEAGYRVGFDPALTLIHDHGRGGSAKAQEGKSRVYRLSQLLYYKKHKNIFQRVLLRIYLQLTGRYPA